MPEVQAPVFQLALGEGRRRGTRWNRQVILFRLGLADCSRECFHSCLREQPLGVNEGLLCVCGEDGAATRGILEGVLMAFNRPIPEKMRRTPKHPSGLSLYVQAEKMLQIAFVLPCALVIGWVLGAWADKWLHQSWITIGGVILGSVSGLVFVIRMAFAAEKNSAPDAAAGSDKTIDRERREG